MATTPEETPLGTAGPHSRAIMDRKAEVVPHATSPLAPFVIERSQGGTVTDVDGNAYYDFTGGWGCLVVGHAHPKIVQAIQHQAERFVHTDFSVIAYESYVELAERLTGYVPDARAHKAAFFNSGAEAVENAVKIARFRTRRPAVVVFEGGFHGRTLLTLSMTHKAQPYKAHFGPFAPEIYRVPFPSPYRTEMTNEAWRRTLELLVDPDDVAALVVEPVQGESGFVVPREGFLPFVQAFAREHGITLVADEIQSGMGRTGRFYASEHFGLEPDLVTLGKSLASGLPLSAVVGTAEIMDALPDGSIGGTYVGNPIACAAGVAVMDVIETEGLLEGARDLGERMAQRFEEWQRRYELVGDVRGVGAMRALELVRDPDAKTPATEETAEIIHKALEEGLILAKAGLHGNVIRLLIPLVLSSEELEDGLDRLEHAIAQVAG